LASRKSAAELAFERDENAVEADTDRFDRAFMRSWSTAGIRELYRGGMDGGILRSSWEGFFNSEWILLEIFEIINSWENG
jgi:hypothetical protein